MNLEQLRIDNLYFVKRRYEIVNFETGFLSSDSFEISVKDNGSEINIYLWKLNQNGGFQEETKTIIKKDSIHNSILNLFYIWQNSQILDYLQIYHEIKLMQL